MMSLNLWKQKQIIKSAEKILGVASCRFNHQDPLVGMRQHPFPIFVTWAWPKSSLPWLVYILCDPFPGHLVYALPKIFHQHYFDGIHKL